jgi:hypothetical protein
MRFTPLLSALIFACLIAGPLSAQTVLYTAVVSQNEAEVRSKPGLTPAIYPTNRLKWGDRVFVVEERADGWLAIVPPEGSFSFVNLRYLQRVVPNQCNWMVAADPQVKVPVIVGSELITDNKRPTVEGAYLERGAQVRSIGKPLEDSDGQWLPIEPPAGEVRYLRAEAVRKLQPLMPVVAALPTPPRETEPSRPRNVVQAIPVSQSTFIPAPPPAASIPAPVAAPPAATPVMPETLWGRAQQAERAGRITEAVELYNQLYAENRATNPDAANWAITRAAFLRSGQRQLPVTTSTGQPQARFVPLQSQVDPPAVTATSRGGFANPPRVDKLPDQQPSRVAQLPDSQPPAAKLNPPSIEGTFVARAANEPSSPHLPGDQTVYSSGPGTLLRAGLRINSQPTYRLDLGEGKPNLYVTAAPGLDLERFLDQKVELIGAAEYHGTLRANHMRAYQVQPFVVNP